MPLKHAPSELSQSAYRHRFTHFTDALVPIYNWGFHRLGGRQHEAFRRRIVELADLQDGFCVLDAGCGTGLTALRIAAQCPACAVYGMDISPRMIDVARRRAEAQGLEVELRVGSIADMPYPDAFFDVVLSNIMFHHLDLAEKCRAIAEVARVLKSGGRYVSAEFGPRARNALERRLAKGEYTLYPSHLTAAGLAITHEELCPFTWGLQVFHRVAVKPLPYQTTKDHPWREKTSEGARIGGARVDPLGGQRSILVCGAGPLGSLFAARLQQGGNHVSLLARGQRLADLREHGIVLEDVRTGERTVTRVNLVEELAPDDAADKGRPYDLVLVIMRRNSALDILPILAANRHTPNVLFLGNNAAGPNAYIEALGCERVLVGFPNAAGYLDGHVIHCLAGTEEDPTSVPFGEVDGRITERTRQVARILDSAPGFGAEPRTDVDVWLKHHVALLFPSLAPALYAAGTDRLRLARTRDLLVLAIRAIREGFSVLRALGYPITPRRFRTLLWIPEPILVLLLRRLLQDELMEVALVRHAEVIRDEVRQLTDEFMALARKTSLPTPAIDRLYSHIDPQTPTVPEGQAQIPMRWDRLLLGVGGLVVLLLSGVMVVRAWRRSRRNRG